MAQAMRTRPQQGPARTGLSSIAAVLATLIGLFVLAYAILWITKGRFLKPHFERIASSRSERQVRVAGDFQLYLNPNVKFLAEGLSVANPAWAKGQLFTGRRLESEISLLPLIFGKRRIRFLDVDGGRLALAWNEQRQNTWTFGKLTGEPVEIPAIRRAAITDTRLTYADPALDLTAAITVGDVAARDTRVDQDIGFRGTGTSRGAPFRLSGRLTAPNETMAGGRNRLAARVDVGDSRIDLAGTLLGATELEGADLKLRVRGGNFQTPFRLLGVVPPATRRFDVTSDLTRRGIEWRFTRIRGTFGDSDVAGSSTVSLPNDRLLIVADLSSRKLDILDVGPWLGYDPSKLDGPGGATVIQTVGGTPRVLPNASLATESLELFDARVNYRAAAIRTGSIPLSNLRMTLDLDKRLLKLSPLEFDVAGGRLTSTIRLDARDRRIVTDYDIALSALPLGRILTSFDVENSGTTAFVRGRLQLKGYGDTVRKSLASSSGRIAIVIPRGTLWVRNIELSELDIGSFLQAAISRKLEEPLAIRCGLFGFTVRDGVAAADPIFVDTERNVIRGTGRFSFKDESLDLKILADSKRFSLFSGQSPIGVNGYFAEPGVNPISRELLTRAGAGLALGALISPVALLAAFVDLGDEEDTNCTPVLRGLRTAAVKAADEAAED